MENGKVENGKKGEGVQILKGVVEATTQKFGGGVKIDGTFYDLAEGLEFPEKGQEIVVKLHGKKIVAWKALKALDEPDEAGGEAGGRSPHSQIARDGIQVPEEVMRAAELFAASIKAVEDTMPGLDRRDTVIVASVIFKELMENGRARQENKGKASKTRN